MARLILHVRYFAPNAKKRVSKLAYLINYYGTREGVEKPTQDAWKKQPVSEAQTKSIDRIIKDLPEVKDFLTDFLPAFDMTLDELNHRSR